MGKGEVIGGVSFEQSLSWAMRGSKRLLQGVFGIDAPVVFLPRLHATLRAEDGRSVDLHIGEDGAFAWLPRGNYRFDLTVPGELEPQRLACSIEIVHRQAMADVHAGFMETTVEAAVPQAIAGDESRWAIEAIAPTPSLRSLGWAKGHADWFFRHFDHAATTVISYLLGDSPLLRGRVLDIGCGDGITDLGIALRTGCEQMVGVDPFRGFERLPGIVAENHLPPDVIPSNLRFMPEDANYLPFLDDSFDVVISWGSVEHMAGGYLQALREAKRVLRHDGLFMVAPGLFYSNIGHHLTEFSDEPFFHLKKQPDEIRRMVLATPPRYIDRSGEFATNEQYWQWFTELNQITVTRFEREMRALDFRPWRVALRTDHLVEYTPEIEHYPLQDLANAELYSSWINRKPSRPR